MDPNKARSCILRAARINNVATAMKVALIVAWLKRGRDTGLAAWLSSSALTKGTLSTSLSSTSNDDLGSIIKDTRLPMMGVSW